MATAPFSASLTRSASRSELSPNERYHSPRKRRLTAPANLQDSAAQAPSPFRATKEIPDQVKIVEDVDELIPQLESLGKEASLFTPESGTFDSAFVPFVLDDGVLSFYTPSDSTESSSDPDRSPSLPTSPVSTPFSPYEFYGTRYNEPILEDFSIWRGRHDAPSHVYAQMLDPSPICEAVPLKTFDPSLHRYAPVYAAMTHPSCQLLRMDIPLTPSPIARSKELPSNSLIMIGSPRRIPLRLRTTVYNQGTLVSSSQVQMEERDHRSEFTSYSASLPQDFIDGVCDAVDRGDSKPGSSSGTDCLDSLLVMQFVQQRDSATDGEEIVLVMVVKFHALNIPSATGVKISYVPSENDVPKEQRSAAVSHAHLSLQELKPPVPSKFPRRPRSLGRPIPKLSVFIPPKSQGASGIRLCTDSPESAVRPTPQTGIPSNVFPVTPFEQLIHTPLNPPQIMRSGASSLSSYRPTPSEGTYQFTLSSTSPGPVPSPAYGILEMSPGMGSAPAWLSLPRNMTPFTPSFFYPSTAPPSNTLTSLTQRALAAGTPPAYCRDEFSEELLASPLHISPSSSLSTSEDTSDVSVLEKVLQWSP